MPINQQSKQDEEVKIFSLENFLGRQWIMSFSLARQLAVRTAIPTGIPCCDWKKIESF